MLGVVEEGDKEADKKVDSKVNGEMDKKVGKCGQGGWCQLM